MVNQQQATHEIPLQLHVLTNYSSALKSLVFSRSRSILANVETPALIRRMSWENRLWDARCIHGELAMLGVRVSRITVAKYIARRPGSPSHTWRTFLRNHPRALVASGADAARRGGTQTMYA
jgi:hypothetical protein